MKSILFAVVFLAPGLWAADEVADRAGIEITIRGLSVNPPRQSLFTSDFDDNELVRLRKSDTVSTPVPGPPGEVSVSKEQSGAMPITVQGVAGTLVISKEPMGEAIWLPGKMNMPLTIRRIRFVTGDVAMVDALGKAPVLIVMRKVGTDWKIASLRILAED
jgi:hypothetical protein